MGKKILISEHDDMPNDSSSETGDVQAEPKRKTKKQEKCLIEPSSEESESPEPIRSGKAKVKLPKNKTEPEPPPPSPISDEEDNTKRTPRKQKPKPRTQAQIDAFERCKATRAKNVENKKRW